MHYINVYKTVWLTQNLSEIQSENSELELAKGSHPISREKESKAIVL